MCKRIIFFALTFFSVGVSFTQHVGFTLATPRWIAMDHIVDRYNATRPWLDKELKQVHTLPGFQFGLGSMSLNEKSSFGLDLFRYQFIRSTARAEFGESFRELRVSLSTFSFTGFQWFPINRSKFAVGIGTYPVELSVYKVRSRTDLEPTFETIYKTFTFIGIPTNASSTFTLDLLYKGSNESKLGVSLRLYYSLFWFIDDTMIFVNQELNPNTFVEHHQEQTIRNSHGGVQLLFNVLSK
jgi:hypothetical protein